MERPKTDRVRFVKRRRDILSNKFNLYDNDPPGTEDPMDQVSTEACFENLGAFGGPTQTRRQKRCDDQTIAALNKGGPLDTAVPDDQRGRPRPYPNTLTDVGAVECQNATTCGTGTGPGEEIPPPPHGSSSDFGTPTGDTPTASSQTGTRPASVRMLQAEVVADEPFAFLGLDLYGPVSHGPAGAQVPHGHDPFQAVMAEADLGLAWW